MDYKQHAIKIKTAAKILKFLGNETRLNLLMILLEQDCSVEEFTSLLDMKPEMVRTQILKLKDSGLVNHSGQRPPKDLYSINRQSDYFDFVKDLLETLPK